MLFFIIVTIVTIKLNQKEIQGKQKQTLNREKVAVFVGNVQWLIK